MLTNFYGIKDLKAAFYVTTFFMLRDEMAVRAFSDSVNSMEKGSQVSNHPEDFVLHRLGEWDDVSGKMKSLEAPVPLGMGSDFVKFRGETLAQIAEREPNV